MIVEVVEHDPNWQSEYEKEAKTISEILQDELVNCFHIGSTAVPGLVAKPIIDILLVVNNVDNLAAFAGSFEAAGYEVMGEFGISGRRYFRKGANHRTHHIHAFQYDNVTEIERHLAFRDYLQVHPAVCEQYGELKQELAKRYRQDIDGYGDGKDSFVKQVEKLALKWHWKVR